MTSQKIYTLKIHHNGSSFLFNMTANDIADFKSSLTKNKWITLTLLGESELNIKSSEISCYEIIEGSLQKQVGKGQMTLVGLAHLMGVHPVTVSKLASSGKIPVVSVQAARRKHSRATLDTALALRENLVKLGRVAPSVERIKQEFKR